MNEPKTQVVTFRARLRYLPRIRNEDTDLMFEFFMVYSRFEASLKEAGYHRTERDGHVAPDWRKFSEQVQEKFNPDSSPELRQAFNYYKFSPPKIQVVENDVLGWKQNTKRENETDFTWMIRSVGIVRNNLFHGGKFPWNPRRDVTLLSHGLTILYKCLELDKRVQDKFNYSPETI
jgi:hypothetical protein